jgi:tetratricopeptide (TPR) repeat protein
VRCLGIAIGIAGLSAALIGGDAISDEIRAAQSSGNYAQAAKLYLQLIAAGSDGPEVRSNCGVMFHMAGENHEALEQFRLALKRNPDSTAANLFAGVSELDLGEPKAALPYLQKAQQLDRYRPAPALALGKAYMALSEYEKANQTYAEAVALDSRLQEAWYGLGVTDRSLAEQILNQAAREGRARSEETKRRVKNLLDKAVQALTRAVELDPNSARTHLLMAESLSNAGKFADAVSEFQTVMKLDPNVDAAYVGLASEYWKQRQFNEALPLLKHILVKSPNDAESNAMMADILEHSGDVNKAEDYAKVALKGKPDLIQPRVVLARIYLAKQQPKLAVDELQQVIGADPDGSYHFLLYRAYRASGDQQAAREALAEFQQMRSGARN